MGYMVVWAKAKNKTAGLNIQWRHENAEKTGFPDVTLDLVTMALLLHKTPLQASIGILQEIF